VLVYFVVVFHLQLYVPVCFIVHCIYLRTILIYVVRKWPLRGEVILCVGISHSKSVVTVQHAFRAKYAKDPPADKTILAWCINNLLKLGVCGSRNQVVAY
jgi:hypothetical protein